MRIHNLSGVPTEALELLKGTALGNTGSSQAARSLLFWLDGQHDPTGYRGDGALELRRLDEPHRAAALKVLDWWTTAERETDQPLREVQAQGMVNAAVEDIGSVAGFADQGTHLASLDRMVKEHWQDVSKRREELQRQN
ncbi:MAG: hypothetical protein KDN22_31175 [Verrucomicrobiae bacterium]|nr:hypothetical protein [Verrucomicrobiae bacterium]